MFGVVLTMGPYTPPLPVEVDKVFQGQVLLLIVTQPECLPPMTEHQQLMHVTTYTVANRNMINIFKEKI